MTEQSIAGKAAEKFNHVIGKLAGLPELQRVSVLSSIRTAAGIGPDAPLTEATITEHVKKLCGGGTYAGTADAFEVVKGLDRIVTEVGRLLDDQVRGHYERLPEVKLLRRFEQLARSYINKLREVEAPRIMYGEPGMDISDSDSSRMDDNNEGEQERYLSECEAQESYELEVEASLARIALNPAFQAACNLEELKDAISGMTDYQRDKVGKIAARIEKESDVELNCFLRLLQCRK